MNSEWVKLAAVFLIPFSIAAFAPVPHVPPHMDLLGMIKGIYDKNNRINETNDEIVTKMMDISQLAETTSRIHGNLRTLSEQQTSQETSLGNLNTLSRKQIDLSIQLNSLAQGLQNDMSQIRQGSFRQRDSLYQMSGTADRLSGLADQLVKANEAGAAKLDGAAQMTGEVNRSMPGL
ncbi:hypothetical protein [Effusibacillus lacus]|uniref:Conjugal transfer protein TrbJ n=1 Tax=Effusibacillus lacus TaxID=1348429 RepID=A0A292YN14_9BACL|nr:hypothetical protein [Effusibacillus lacus]TCS68158.1 hypothetical protein EDD64_14510 [Effusibacillus lacus]GAX90289.1 hypothetical protein EFBL_1915 [Effusibacillus lacus]